MEYHTLVDDVHIWWMPWSYKQCLGDRFIIFFITPFSRYQFLTGAESSSAVAVRRRSFRDDIICFVLLPFMLYPTKSDAFSIVYRWCSSISHSSLAIFSRHFPYRQKKYLQTNKIRTRQIYIIKYKNIHGFLPFSISRNFSETKCY